MEQKPSSKNVNRRHYLQESSCSMCKSIDRFQGQEKKKKDATRTQT